MDTCRKRSCKTKGVIAVLILALCVSMMSVAKTNAASRPAKPKYKLTKRTKKTATLKVSNSKGVTGYQIYLKSGKKGKWKLHTIAFHKSKIKLTKLKPNKVYYVKLKAWRTRGRSFRWSKYSKTVKIGKYKKKSAVKTTPTPVPTPVPMPPNEPATEPAVSVPEPTSTPEPSATPMP